MKLKTGGDLLKAKSSVGVFLGAGVEYQGNSWKLNAVRFGDIEKMKRESREKNNGDVLRGMPAYIAFSELEQTFFLYPAADKTYEVEIYYHGPVQKM